VTGLRLLPVTAAKAGEGLRAAAVVGRDAADLAIRGQVLGLCAAPESLRFLLARAPQKSHKSGSAVTSPTRFPRI